MALARAVTFSLFKKRVAFSKCNIYLHDDQLMLQFNNLLRKNDNYSRVSFCIYIKLYLILGIVISRLSIHHFDTDGNSSAGNFKWISV